MNALFAKAPDDALGAGGSLVRPRPSGKTARRRLPARRQACTGIAVPRCAAPTEMRKQGNGTSPAVGRARRQRAPVRTHNGKLPGTGRCRPRATPGQAGLVRRCSSFARLSRCWCARHSEALAIRAALAALGVPAVLNAGGAPLQDRAATIAHLLDALAAPTAPTGCARPCHRLLGRTRRTCMPSPTRPTS